MSFAGIVGADGDRPPRWLDVRFDAAGAPLRCSGNTMVCHLRDDAGRAAVSQIVARLASAPAGGCFAFTAPESWHMTVFNGLLHEGDRHRRDFWPAGLPSDAADDEADAFMLDRMATVDPPDTFIQMVATGFSGLASHGLGIALAPATTGEERAIRTYRDRLAEATGLQARPGHADYRFHLTLAYLVRWPSETEAEGFDTVMQSLAAEMGDLFPPFRLGPPELCLFDHMDEFRVERIVTPARAATPAE
ncbi:DUF1868 domain-containing protein [Oceaniradius stylonematis]|uniref:DUF1868 domain-containing protein n=1 Tax=Oceaniradius stylonematis TaxID=2184161 RepID=A0A3A8AAA9_9HYPH|nr:DUF1868 domain-containing protein [Oceaniradius stylonematis]RKF07247.1 DUF1868 domain-containing protein [Oceaniradius stylonematis]